MTDRDIDDALLDILKTHRQEANGQYKFIYDDRQAMMICAQAIVESIRQVRDGLIPAKGVNE